MASGFSNFPSLKRRTAMKRAFISVAIAAFLFVLAPIPSFSQTAVDTRDAEMIQALVNGHVAWRTKLSSTGASIQAKEVERQGSLVKYYLTVSGLPTDELYAVMSWPVGQQKPTTIMEGISIGKDGTLICAGRKPEQCGDPSKKDDPVDFGFEPAKGEPYRLALVSGEYRADIVIVHDRIAAKAKDCTLSAERLLPHFELAWVSWSGFPPNSEPSFEGEPYGEKQPIMPNA